MWINDMQEGLFCSRASFVAKVFRYRASSGGQGLLLEKGFRSSEFGVVWLGLVCYGLLGLTRRRLITFKDAIAI